MIKNLKRLEKPRLWRYQDMMKKYKGSRRLDKRYQDMNRKKLKKKRPLNKKSC